MEQKDILKKEIDDIYQILIEFDKKNFLPLFDNLVHHPQTCSLSLKYIISPIVSCIIFISTSYILKHFGIIEENIYFIIFFISLILFLFGYAAIIPISILESFSKIKEIYKDRGFIIKMIQNPIPLILEGLSKKSKEDISLVEQINSFSLDALCMSKSNIDEQRKAISHRLNILTGRIDKIGIIPGIISIYIAFYHEGFRVPAIVTAIIFSIFYFLGFSIQFSLPRLSFYVQLLDMAIKNKEK